MIAMGSFPAFCDEISNWLARVPPQLYGVWSRVQRLLCKLWHSRVRRTAGLMAFELGQNIAQLLSTLRVKPATILVAVKNLLPNLLRNMVGKLFLLGMAVHASVNAATAGIANFFLMVVRSLLEYIPREYSEVIIAVAEVFRKTAFVFRRPVRFATTIVAVGVATWRFAPKLMRFVKVLMYNPELHDLIRSKLMAYCRVPLNNGLRAAIQYGVQEFPKQPLRDAHPHKVSAEFRNAATGAIDKCVKSMGFDPYPVSPSGRDPADSGYRCYYALADLSQEMRTKPIGEESVITMIDVDFHANMHGWLSYGRPILAYTFQPTKCGFNGDSYAYYIEDDTVHFTSNGGGEYVHQVWDYNRDIMYTAHWLGRYLGKYSVFFWPFYKLARLVADKLNIFIPRFLEVIVFYVETKRAGGEGRMIVGLAPFATLPSFFLDQVERMGPELRRMRYSCTPDFQPNLEHAERFNAINFFSEDGTLCINIAREGAYESATFTHAEYEACRTKRKSGATIYPGTLSTCLSRMNNESEKETSQFRATLMCAFLNSGSSIPTLPVFRPGDAAEHFTPLGTKELEDLKPIAVRYGPVICDEVVYPWITPENANLSVHRRVRAVANNKEPGALLQKYAADFAHELVGDLAHTGEPLTLEEVDRIQSRPLQRARTLREIENAYPDRPTVTVSAFIKHEACATPGPPRNISSVNTSHTLELSAYTYPFKWAVLKRVKSYVPGCEPCEIAERLQSLVLANDWVYEGDYSKFDGTISSFLRKHVERAVYLRWAAPSHKMRLSSLISAEWKAPAKTQFHEPYSSGFSRLSGSPLTTDGNTIINMFVAYACMRHSKVPCILDDLGLFFGDDCVISGNYDASHTAKILGLELKNAKRERGEPVTFLARVFYDLEHSTASYASASRALPKLHATCDRACMLGQAAVNKAVGYLTTDAHTPIVREYCQMILAYYTGFAARADTALDIPHWALTYDEDGKRVFQNSPWPQQPDDDERIIGHMAAELNFDVEALVALQRELHRRATMPVISEEDLMAPLTQLQREPPDSKVDAVLHTDVRFRPLVGVLEDNHLGLADGSRVRHQHQCRTCGECYAHEHLVDANKPHEHLACEGCSRIAKAASRLVSLRATAPKNPRIPHQMEQKLALWVTILETHIGSLTDYNLYHLGAAPGHFEKALATNCRDCLMRTLSPDNDLACDHDPYLDILDWESVHYSEGDCDLFEGVPASQILESYKDWPATEEPAVILCDVALPGTGNVRSQYEYSYPVLQTVYENFRNDQNAIALIVKTFIDGQVHRWIVDNATAVVSPVHDNFNCEAYLLFLSPRHTPPPSGVSLFTDRWFEAQLRAIRLGTRIAPGGTKTTENERFLPQDISQTSGTRDQGFSSGAIGSGAAPGARPEGAAKSPESPPSANQADGGSRSGDGCHRGRHRGNTRRPYGHSAPGRRGSEPPSSNFRSNQRARGSWRGNAGQHRGRGRRPP